MRLVFMLILFFAATLPSRAAAGVLGDWRSPTQSFVRIEPCGNSVCARLIKLPPSAPVTTDTKNPNSALRRRPLCGLAIGTGFHADDADHLTGGRLYDPQSGKTYKGSMTASGNTLKLRGYVGLPAFGRTETWQRTPAIEACKP